MRAMPIRRSLLEAGTLSGIQCVYPQWPVDSTAGDAAGVNYCYSIGALRNDRRRALPEPRIQQTVTGPGA